MTSELDAARRTELGAAFHPQREDPRTTLPSPSARTDGLEVGSSEWWIVRLLGRLRERNTRLAVWRSYYEGTWDVYRLANQAHRDTFGTRFSELRANLAEPVVEAPEQRLNVIGFILAGDEAGGDLAWRYWMENELDDESSRIHLDMLAVGECPVFVSQDPAAPGLPLITREVPENVYVEPPPTPRAESPAAIHTWLDEDGKRVVVLIRPELVEWWRSERSEEPGRESVWRMVEGSQRENTVGIVPIVTLRNAPHRRAEHDGIESQLDLYAKTLMDMATAADHAGYPQRYATGVAMDEEDVEVDADGNPTESAAPSMSGGPNRMLAFENPETGVGQFTASDLSAFVRVMDAIRADIAIQTHTPTRLLVPPPTSVPPSGESVRLSDFGLTSKVERKQASAGNGWSRVMRYSFLAAGDTERSARRDLEVAWKDPELRTEAEHMDALIKMRAVGVPQEEIWRRLGASPQMIRRWRELAAAEAIERTAADEETEDDQDADPNTGADGADGAAGAAAAG